MILAPLAVLTLSACSSVTPLASAGRALPDNCPIQVYLTYQQATQPGPIEELCVIDGTSSGSWHHTVATAIEKHKQKACACGASGVYVQSRSDSGLDVATVTLVAFRRAAP
jgi:hypothetical protein